MKIIVLNLYFKIRDNYSFLLYFFQINSSIILRTINRLKFSKRKTFLEYSNLLIILSIDESTLNSLWIDFYIFTMLFTYICFFFFFFCKLYRWLKYINLFKYILETNFLTIHIFPIFINLMTRNSQVFLLYIKEYSRQKMNLKCWITST